MLYWEYRDVPKVSLSELGVVFELSMKLVKIVPFYSTVFCLQYVFLYCSIMRQMLRAKRKFWQI